jgi:ketosteroid isomerase-like protein
MLILQGPVKAAPKEIQARYQAWDAGFRNHDPKILDNLMTDDFKTESPDGKTLGRDEALKSFRGLILGARQAKWPRRIVKTTMKGSDILVTVRGRFEGMLPGPDHKLHKTELSSTVDDLWTHTAAGWRIKSSKMDSMEMKSDGKRVSR